MDFDRLMEYQNMMQQRLRQEQKMSRKIDLLNVINQLTVGPKGTVQTEQVILEGRNRGFDEDEIERMIDELIDDGIIYRPSSGYLMKR